MHSPPLMATFLIVCCVLLGAQAQEWSVFAGLNGPGNLTGLPVNYGDENCATPSPSPCIPGSVNWPGVPNAWNNSVEGIGWTTSSGVGCGNVYKVGTTTVSSVAQLPESDRAVFKGFFCVNDVSCNPQTLGPTPSTGTCSMTRFLKVTQVAQGTTALGTLYPMLVGPGTWGSNISLGGIDICPQGQVLTNMRCYKTATTGCLFRQIECSPFANAMFRLDTTASLLTAGPFNNRGAAIPTPDQGFRLSGSNMAVTGLSLDNNGDIFLRLRTFLINEWGVPAIMDVGLDGLVISSPGTTCMFVWFNDSRDDTVIATWMQSGTTSHGSGTLLVPNRTTGVVPVTFSPCGKFPYTQCLQMNTTANLTVWLTTRVSYYAATYENGGNSPPPGNTTVIGTVLNKQILITNDPATTTVGGMFHLTVPPNIYFNGTDKTISLPISQLACGSNDNSTAVLGVMMRFDTGSCGTTFLPDVSCTSPPSNFLFEFNSTCSIVGERTYFLTALLFTPAEYDFFLNKTINRYDYYPDELFAGYSRQYNFSAKISPNITLSSSNLTATVVLPPEVLKNGTVIANISPGTNSTLSNSIISIVLQDPSGNIVNVSDLPTPVTITFAMKIPMNLNAVSQCLGSGFVVEPVLPTCSFLNEEISEWESDGCSLASFNVTHVQCQCTHFTQFAVTAPKHNKLVSDVFLELTPSNLGAHPTGLIIVFLILVIFAIMFVVAVLRDRKEAAQYEQMKSLKHEKWKKFAAKSTFLKQVKIAFQKRHTWFSLAFRKSGTSFRSVDRTFVTLLSAFASMSMSAFYHAQDNNNMARVGVIIISVVVCAIPSQLLTLLFVRTGPMGFYEEWEQSRQPPKSNRCLTYRFPERWRHVWRASTLIAVIAMIVYVLAMSVNFDRQPYYFCQGGAAVAWVGTWLIAYMASVLLLEPLRIVLLALAQHLRPAALSRVTEMGSTGKEIEEEAEEESGRSGEEEGGSK